MDEKQINPLKDKRILITGASRGLGRSLAVKLAHEGAELILTGREQGALQETDDMVRKINGNGATLVIIDLAKHDEIDQFGGALYQRFKSLDGFISNAAQLGDLSPLSTMNVKNFEMTMDVNFTANFRLIRSLEPLLRFSKSPSAALFISCNLQAPPAFWGGYLASKAALEMLVACWQEEVKNTHIRTSCIDPGQMGTRLRQHAFPGFDYDHWPSPDEAADKVIKKFISLFTYE